jgi:hypothetical protein
MPRDEDMGLAVNSADFLNRIPVEVRDTFTDQQIAAVNDAFKAGAHSVDIRLSIPFIGGRRYLVLLMGKEKRSKERRRFERMRQSLFTAWNVFTMMVFGALIFFFTVGLVYMLIR